MDIRQPQGAAGRFTALAASVKLRLALLAMLALGLSIGITTHMLLSKVERRTERAVLDLKASSVERMAAVAANRVVVLQQGLTAVAKRLGPLMQAPADKQRAALRESGLLQPAFAMLFIAFADGTFRNALGTDSDSGSALNIGDRPYFKRTLSTRAPVVSEPVLSRVANEATIMLTMPILGDDGSVIAMVCGSLRLGSRNLFDDLVQRNELHAEADGEASTMVIDSQGRVLAHPDSERVLSDAEQLPGLRVALARWVAQGRPVEPTADALRSGADHLVAYAGVPGTDWIVLQVAAADALMGHPAAARQHGWAVAAAAAALGGLLFTLLAWLLLRPLGRLQTLARASDAEVETAEWPEGRSEIGRLATALRTSRREQIAGAQQAALAAQQMQSLLAAAPIGIAFTRDRKFELVSRQFSDLLGYPESELVGRPARDIYISEQEYIELAPQVGAAFAQGKPFFSEMRFLRMDGSVIWGRLQGQPVDRGDATAGTIWLLEDVTQRRAERERIAWAASHDALTRLHNRESFERALAALLTEQPRRAHSALLCIDLDRFKAINDNAGHAAGDQVLRDVAAMLQANVRPSDIVARPGGDEFAILLPGCNVHDAQRIAERVRDSAGAIGIDHEGKRLSIGASIGVVAIGPHDDDAAALLAQADAACYAAKHAGRGAVRVAPALRVVGG